MKEDVKNKWVAALRSEDYKQGRNALESNGSFCCLGVLSNIAVEEGLCTKKTKDNSGKGLVTFYDKFDNFGWEGTLPMAVKEWADMKDTVGTLPDGVEVKSSLLQLNDSAKYSFEQIADVIERNWKEL